MRRISTTTKVVDKFGTGKHGFTNGSAVGGVPATDLEDVWFDHVQEEISTFIEAAGLTLDVNNRSQLLGALQKFVQATSMTVGVDTGSANVYAVAYVPAITAPTDGMVLWFKVKTANTGASTLNVNGLGASPLIGAGHSAMQGGELVVGGRAQVVWRADISSWVLVECTGGALQAVAGSQSNHVPSLGQFQASLGASGYIKLPMMVGGVLRTVIVQWGISTLAISSTLAVTLPIAFPTAGVLALASGYSTSFAAGSAPSFGATVGLTQIVLQNMYTASTASIAWLAIGW